MAGFVTITPLVIGADGSGTTQNTVQAAVNNLAGQVQNTLNGLTGGLTTPRIVAQSAVPASVTGTLSETTLATIAIPAGAMGVNGKIRVVSYWSCTNNANGKTVNFRIAGSLFGATGSLANNASACYQQEIMAVNATNAQKMRQNPAAPFGSSTGGISTLAVDMTQAQNITLTAVLTNVGDTVTLEAYTVEILNP